MFEFFNSEKKVTRQGLSASFSSVDWLTITKSEMVRDPKGELLGSNFFSLFLLLLLLTSRQLGCHMTPSVG